MVYGLFVLLAGLGSLFFLFNTGQLVAEKTKLVNTADAVAYSAGVMHARALNFNSYTNRAMIANEVFVAQVVSTMSWAQYAGQHAQRAVLPLNCTNYYNVPAPLLLVKYTPLCMGIAYLSSGINSASSAVINVGKVMVASEETLIKSNLELAQSTMLVTLIAGRHALLQQVADANYKNNGVVKVDNLSSSILLTDNLLAFDGGPFMSLYTGKDRTRFKNVEVAAAYNDPFVKNRAWSDSTPGPGCPLLPLRGNADRTGSTALNGFDEWRARDRATLGITHLDPKWYNPLHCSTSTITLGTGDKRAKASGGDVLYMGVPIYYELSTKALAYTPANKDANKQDPRLKFAVRLTRANTEARTSMGKSQVKPTGQLNVFQGNEAKDVMAAVATSEVYFDRSGPAAREDGRTEYASLFNPFWQVHLINNSTADVAAAIALQAIK